MSAAPVHPGEPAGAGDPSLGRGGARRPSPLARLGIVAAVAGTLVFLLWWLDPREAPVPMCGFHTATGLHCPGCGATRATHELLHGRLDAALAYNPLWVAFLPLALYWGASEGLWYVCRRRLPQGVLRSPWFVGAVVAAALVFAVLRNLPWEPFCGLAPG